MFEFPRARALRALLSSLALLPPFAFLSPSAARAQELPEPRWSLWGGAGAGYTHLNPGAGGEKRKNGFNLRADALLAHRRGPWDFEAGVGFLYNRISSGKGEETRREPDGSFKQEKDLTIRSRTPDASILVRREVGPDLRVGPLARLILDENVSFTKTQKDKGPHLLAGVQGAYETGWIPALDDRAIAEVTTDLTIPRRQVFFVTLGFQVGVGVPTAHAVESEPVPAPVATAAPTAALPPVADIPKVRVTLDGQIIYFDTAKASLSPALDAFVSRLGKILASKPGAWEALRIEGHTDSRGKLEYNLDLSARRAETIKTLLVKEGNPQTRITTEGFGPKQPAISPEKSAEDRQRNRRVIFVFDGVREPEVLQKQIRDLREELHLLEATALPPSEK